MATIGPFESLASLAQELGSGSRGKANLKRFEEQGYTGWRRSCHDGNSFYRAVAFGLLERLVTADAPHREERVAALVEQLAGLSFEDQAAREAHAELLARLERLRRGGGWEAPSLRDADMTALGLLYSCWRAPNSTIDTALVSALRKLTAQYLLQKGQDASVNQGIPFETECQSDGFAGVKDFTSRVVLNEGTDGRGVCHQALAAALGVSLRVAMLDGDASGDMELRDFGLGGKPLVHLKSQDGHFDLLCVPEERSRYAHAMPAPSMGDADCFTVGCGGGKPPTFGDETFGECAMMQPLAEEADESPQRRARARGRF